MEDIKRKRIRALRANLMLILTAVIWGSAFVAQDSASTAVHPFSLNCSRFFIGAVVLIPVFLYYNSKEDKSDKAAYKAKMICSVKGGVFCGLALFGASALQQLGISAGTDAGKAGFITVMYIVLVPLLGLFIKKRVGLLAWIAVAIAPIGLYFLCIQGDFKFAVSDLLILLCAVVFAIHILVIDYYSPKSNGVLMSCIQFFVVSALSGVFMLITERPYIVNIANGWLEILYLGVMSCGVAYTLQIIAQKDTNPTVASLLMSLESVFAMIFGAIILSQTPTLRELFGSFLIFAAVILAQLPSPTLKRRKKK